MKISIILDIDFILYILVEIRLIPLMVVFQGHSQETSIVKPEVSRQAADYHINRRNVVCEEQHSSDVQLEVEANCVCWKVLHCAAQGELSGSFVFLLFGAVDVLKRILSAISVKWFGPFPCVIQVLQSQLIEWAGKWCPRQWSLAGSRADL